MRNIGILTIFRIYNHGSFLQSFAMKKIIENVSKDKVKCEFIDWPQKRVQINRKKVKWCNPRSIRFWIHKLLGHTIFCEDNIKGWISSEFRRKYELQLKDYLNVSKNHNNNVDYDLIFVGSDEVFNCTQDDAGWDSLFCFNLPKASKIYSYAACFGYTNVQRLEEYCIKEAVKNGLSEYQEIWVRDENSASVVNSLIGRNCKICFDPVLIFDYDEYIPKVKIKNNFILVYNYFNRIDDPKFIALFKSWAKKEKLKIISIFEYCPWADENIALTSFEVLAYFKKAKYVITDTFHGCVMSIKYNKQFASFIWDSNRNKLGYLLRTFNLYDRIINNPTDFEHILSEVPDWESINRKIKEETDSSMEYFRKALNQTR